MLSDDDSERFICDFFFREGKLIWTLHDDDDDEEEEKDSDNKRTNQS